jgi:hypothetical protein
VGPNELVRGRPVSDYDGAIDLQDALNAKQTQIGRVLAKHADPKLAFPGVDGRRDRATCRATEVYFFRRRTRSRNTSPGTPSSSGDGRPQVRPEPAAVRTETSPVLLG